MILFFKDEGLIIKDDKKTDVFSPQKSSEAGKRGLLREPFFIFPYNEEMKVNSWACLCCLLFLFSCSTQQKYLLTRVTTPEVAGGGNNRFDIAVSKATRMQPSTNIGAVVVDSHPTLSSSAVVNAMNAFGLTDFMDIEASWGPQQSFLTSLKIQFLGAPTSSAAQGNFSLALRAGYGLNIGAGKVSREELVDRRLAERTYIIESGYGVFDLMLGYRILAPLLVYVGVFRDDGRYALNFEKGIKTKIEHSVDGSGISFGTQYQRGNLLLHLFGASGKIELPQSQVEKRQLDIGVSLGLLY